MMDRLEDEGNEQHSNAFQDHRYHTRRLGDQRLETLTSSPVAKLIGWFVTTIFLPVVAWGLLTLLSEVRRLNEAFAKNNTVTAIFDLRLTTVESNLASSKNKRDDQIKALEMKDTDHDTRLTILEQNARNRHAQDN